MTVTKITLLGAIFEAVIVATEQCTELNKALGQSERHTQRHKAVSLDHAEKGLFEPVNFRTRQAELGTEEI